jgi:hypothetical protein
LKSYNTKGDKNLNCPKCGASEYGVIKTTRFRDYDLREVYCKNKNCNHIYWQKIEKINYMEFRLLRSVTIEKVEDGTEVQSE